MRSAIKAWVPGEECRALRFTGIAVIADSFVHTAVRMNMIALLLGLLAMCRSDVLISSVKHFCIQLRICPWGSTSVGVDNGRPIAQCKFLRALV